MTTYRSEKLFRALVAAGLALCAMLVASEARAVKYGMRTITSNTTLTDHQYGAVIFGANNITLDCAGFQVHISSYTKPNCGAGNAQKCAVVAIGRSNVHVKNCNIVGGFDYGAYMSGTNNSSIVWTQSNAITGFRFEGNTNLKAEALDANFCAAGGYELRDNVNTKVYYSWATGVSGDGFDENRGTTTYYSRDTRATNSGVNGFECDNCLDITYGYPGTNQGGLRSEGNGQHGISIDNSQSIYVWHGTVQWNNRDGVRFQNVTNAPGYHFSDFYQSYSFGNSRCDCRSDNSYGDVWDLSGCGSKCGNFWD
jgi:hypothetical protein